MARFFALNQAQTKEESWAANIADQDTLKHEACDMVKSQISVPMLVRGKVRGVFHVESYFRASFKPDREGEFVEKCAEIVAKCLQGTATLDFVNA